MSAGSITSGGSNSCVGVGPSKSTTLEGGRFCFGCADKMAVDDER